MMSPFSSMTFNQLDFRPVKQYESDVRLEDNPRDYRLIQTTGEYVIIPHKESRDLGFSNFGDSGAAVINDAAEVVGMIFGGGGSV